MLLYDVVDVIVVVIVVMFLPTYFYTGCIQLAGRGGGGGALVPSAIPASLCDDFKSCNRNSAKSDYWV